MLVLARRQGEEICIGKDVIITVLQTDRGRVRLGIEAPKDVPVDREEVRERMKLEHIEFCSTEDAVRVPR